MAKKSTRRKSRQAKPDPLRINDADLLGFLRQHGDHIMRIDRKIDLIIKDISQLRHDLVKSDPTADTHEPHVEGMPPPPKLIPGKAEEKAP